MLVAEREPKVEIEKECSYELALLVDEGNTKHSSPVNEYERRSYRPFILHPIWYWLSANAVLVVGFQFLLPSSYQWKVFALMALVNVLFFQYYVGEKIIGIFSGQVKIKPKNSFVGRTITGLCKLLFKIWKPAAVILVLLLFNEFARATAVYCGVQLATDREAQSRFVGMKILRMIGADRELGQRSKTAHGSWTRVERKTAQELYYKLTGLPFYNIKPAGTLLPWENPDPAFGTPNVGQMIPPLSLKESNIIGKINTADMTANLHWSFVFHNNSSGPCEARAQIQLPPGAIVNDMIFWIQGKARKAAFDSQKVVRSAYWGTLDLRKDPAIVSVCGPDRVLLHCGPILRGADTKVQVDMMVPLRANSGGTLSFCSPRLIQHNYQVGTDSKIHLESDGKFLVEAGDVKTEGKVKRGLYVSDLKINADDLSKNFVVELPCNKPLVLNTMRTGNQIKAVRQFIARQQTIAPQELIVLVDGSAKMQPHVNSICSALEKLPKTVNTSVMLASDDSAFTRNLLPLSQGIRELRTSNFIGGQNNWDPLYLAVKKLAAKKNTAILWLHSAKEWTDVGDRSNFTAKYDLASVGNRQMKIYDFPVENGPNQIIESLQLAECDISIFESVERYKDVRTDLERLFAGWQPDAECFTVVRKIDNTQATEKSVESKNLPVFFSNESVQHLIATGKKKIAAKLAAENKLVTVVSGAVVLEQREDYERAGIKNIPDDVDPVKPADQPPSLQGATNNGTIGPPGDTTITFGTSSAGTVRVNNLAGLEALLNIIANGMEILGLAWGVPMCLIGLFRMKTDGKHRLVLGGISIIVGLAMPGCINWMVACACDANLFS